MATGKKIELTIVDLNIESSGTDCPYDHLKVLNSDSSLLKVLPLRPGSMSADCMRHHSNTVTP